MKTRFEWNESKDRINQRKHAVSFEEARRLFESGVDYLEIFDEAHSVWEDRFVCIGPIRRGLIVVVITEPQEDTLRILSARMTTKHEARMYARWSEGQKK